MKKNLFISAIIIVAISIFVISCNKEEKFKIETNDLVTFQNEEDYNTELNKVLSLSTEELSVYEKEKGYESYGRICDEFYENIDFESFKTSEELVNYINSNSDYLFLLKDEDNELYVETNLYNIPERYFLNKDKMFAVNKNVYKAIENYLIVTDIENIEELKNIDERNVDTYLKNESFSFMPVKSESISENNNKDAECNVGIYKELDSPITDNNKTKMIHEITFQPGTIGGSQCINHLCKVLIRPYKKTLGIWYWCTRTISCNIKIAYDKINSDYTTWTRGFYYKIETKYDSKLEYVVSSGFLSWGSGDPQMHFAGYDSWADTPSNDPVKLQANTYLF